METQVMLSEKLKSKLIKLAEKENPEIYWDYNDELSSEQIEQIIAGNIDDVENKIWEMNMDYIWDIERETIKNIIDEMEDEIEEELEERDLWEDEIMDLLRDYISVDLNIKDLIRSTGEQVFFYDTGFEVDSGSWQWKDAELRLWRMQLKKHLKVVTSKYDSAIEMMLRQASYGGQLVIYFNADINELATDKKAIKFTDPCIAIIDTCNGSGDDTFLPGHSLTLPFDKDNLHYERSIKYNYTFSVCGMSSDWCSATGYSFVDEDAGEALKSSLNASIEQDRKYAETFRQGKCTFGDMDYTRHRNTSYVNNYPCGNRCADCGTFWID